MAARYLLFLTSLMFLLPVAGAQAAEDEFYSQRAMTPELALRATRAALEACRESDAQVAVAVVDRGGNVQTLMRDRYAGPHTPDTAISKAWTAVSFRTDTNDMVASTQAGEAQSGARDIPGALMLGGGMKIEAQGSIVGGIGVSGAPGGDEDHACAEAGIEAVKADLEL